MLETGDYPIQIQSLRLKSYRSRLASDNASELAIARLSKLEFYQELKSQDCDETLRLKPLIVQVQPITVDQVNISVMGCEA